jgi:hypothetical protein
MKDGFGRIEEMSKDLAREESAVDELKTILQKRRYSKQAF